MDEASPVSINQQNHPAKRLNAVQKIMLASSISSRKVSLLRLVKLVFVAGFDMGSRNAQQQPGQYDSTTKLSAERGLEKWLQSLE